jgi:ferredoxin like protein
MQLAQVADRLAVNSYHVDDEHPHIDVNQEQVRRTGCAELLARVCPARVYTPAPDGGLHVEYAACLECGTCLAVAPPGTLTWHYPRGSFGVQYRAG